MADTAGETDIESLQGMVTELEALGFAYPGGLVLAPVEAAQLSAARMLCGLEPLGHEASQPTGRDDAEEEMCGHGGALSELSGLCQVPDVQLGGQPVMLRFQLPITYPRACAKLSVLCGATRPVHDQLTEVVVSCAAREQGECCLLTAMQELKDAATAAAETQAATADEDARVSSSQHTGPFTIMRRCIWFHHIKSLAKRKTIIDAARDLNLGGGSKPGFPGVIIVEGGREDVEEYTAQLRALRWQAMQVRGTESEELALREGADHQAALMHARKLPLLFVEFPESGMSEMAAMCKQARLDTLFASALKLNEAPGGTTRQP